MCVLSASKILKGFVTDCIAKTLFLLMKMNLQEVKKRKFSPAARYTKESLDKSID